MQVRKWNFLLFVIFVAPILTFAQTATLKGNLIDSLENKSTLNAVISILTQKDSALVSFARADKNGRFQFSNLNEGPFILMVTHPYMGDYFDMVSLIAGQETDLGKLFLTPKTKLLAAVIVQSGTPIRIRGDTTVYTADSFKVRPGANVEELLRKLPGIQVDKNGKITAMGEQVKKVLVDGEEFFGSDPGIATKNLRADAVNEVQVFDKKSDQAEFTGIDDGVKDKTINLKMKKKDGYFGKIETGGGLKDKFNNSVMLNSFRNKRKLAGYGIVSNTGQTNLDWQDAQNYGGGGAFEADVTDDGGFSISFNSDDNSNYRGGQNGIPTNWNGGLHYSDKFGKNEKQSFNSGYKFSKVNSPATTSVFSNIFLKDSSWNSRSRNETLTSTDKHAFNLTLDLFIDSLNTLKWTNKVNNRNGNSYTDFYSESISTELDTINNSTRQSNDKFDNNNINSTLLWRHKFKKLSRTLSIKTDFNWSESKSIGLLYSLNKFYSNGTLNKQDTIDQENRKDNNVLGLSMKVAYTEPLIKDSYLELSYSISLNNNSNERVTNKKNSNGKYIDQIDSLSNSFVFNRLVHTPGVNFRVNKKKYNFSFGTSIGLSNFEQKNVTENKAADYHYTNFFPSASFTYKFKPNTSFRFNYNGATSAPALEQLQPIRVNTDPLNIYLGNPDLQQSFRHSFSSGYNFYNVLKENNLWTNLNASFVQNAFTQSSNIDASGKRTYQTVNASGVYNINLNSEYGIKITKYRIHFGLGPNISTSRNIDFLNNIKNINTGLSYGFRMSLSKWVEKKFDFYISPRFSWVKSKSTVNNSANASYWQMAGWASSNVQLPKNFEFSTDLETEIRQKDPRFTQNNSFSIWNASIKKRFLKDNKLELKFGLYDILNQRRGYNRNFSSFSFTETYYTTLKRFWLLTLTWNIAKNGKPASF